MSRENDESDYGLLGLLALGGLFVWAHHENKKEAEKEAQEAQRLAKVQAQEAKKLAEERQKREQEYQRKRELEVLRKNTLCTFDDGISETEFAELAYSLAKKIRRVKRLSVSGPIIRGEVESQSGISSWKFSVDFNDFGHLTGKYWVSSENYDSNIPNRIGQMVSEKLVLLLPSATPTPPNEYTTFNTDVGCEYQESYDEGIDETECEESTLDVCSPRKKIVIWATVVSLIILSLVGFSSYRYWQYSMLIPIGIMSDSVQNQNYHDVYDILVQAGFTSICTVEQADISYDESDKEGYVVCVTIDGDSSYSSTDKYPYDANIVITYHTLAPVFAPLTSKDAKGMLYSDIQAAFTDAGFVNLVLEPIPDIVLGWFAKEGDVDSILINGDSTYSTDTQFSPDAEVTIKYHTSKDK